MTSRLSTAERPRNILCNPVEQLRVKFVYEPGFGRLPVVVLPKAMFAGGREIVMTNLDGEYVTIDTVEGGQNGYIYTNATTSQSNPLDSELKREVGFGGLVYHWPARGNKLHYLGTLTP